MQIIGLLAIIAAIGGGGYAFIRGEQRSRMLGVAGAIIAVVGFTVAIPVPFANLAVVVAGAGLGLFAMNTAKVEYATKLSQM